MKMKQLFEFDKLSKKAKKRVIRDDRLFTQKFNNEICAILEGNSISITKEGKEMKTNNITFNTNQIKHLKHAIDVLSKIIPKKSKIPILSNVMFYQNVKDKITLIATNMKCYCKMQIDCITDGNSFKGIVPFSLFKKIISSCSKEIKIKTDEDECFWHINGFKVLLDGTINEYPEIESRKCFNNHEIFNSYTDIIAKNLELARLHAIDKKDTIYSQCILFDIDNKLNIVGTNGKALAIQEVFVSMQSSEKHYCLIPIETSDVISKAFNGKKPLKKYLTFYSKQNKDSTYNALFETENFELYVRLIEDSYPPYRKVIPDTSSYLSFTIKNETLNDCIVDMKKVCIKDQDGTPSIGFSVSIENQEIKLYSVNPNIGEIEKRIPIENIIGNKDLKNLSINPYLFHKTKKDNIFSHLDKYIFMMVKDIHSPVLIKESNQNSIITIMLMPLEK